MATKPRAAKAPIQAAATKQTRSKPAAKAAAKPVVKSTAKPAVKSAAKSPAKPAVKAAAKSVKPAAKPVAKAVLKAPVKTKPVAKPAVQRTAAPVPPVLKRAAKAVVSAAQPAVSNPVLVRDSFTMPEAEYAVFASTKQRCLQAGVDIKKSELLRIGMALVGQLDVATLQSVLSGLPQLKTGRPRSEQGSL